MKKVFLSVVAIAAIGAAIYLTMSKEKSPAPAGDNGANQTQNTGEPVEILMTSGKFQPESITIKAGTKVTFKNQDSVSRWPASNLHPTHGIFPEFDPKQPISPGGEWSFVFDKAGTWKFHDHLLPSLRGTITVTQ